MAQVLVVDDSGFHRGVVRRALQGTGHTFLEAPNGRVGLEMVRKHSPDCILLDILMPELDGIEVLRALREASVTTPVVVLTSDVHPRTRQQCEQLGARGFLVKPAMEYDLRKAIDGCLVEPAPSA